MTTLRARVSELETENVQIAKLRINLAELEEENAQLRSANSSMNSQIISKDEELKDAYMRIERINLDLEESMGYRRNL